MASEPPRSRPAFDLAALERPGEHCADVVPVLPKPRALRHLLGPEIAAPHHLRQLREVRRVPPPELLGFAGGFEPLDRELADRLQHAEPAAFGRDEALVDQGLQRIEAGVAHRLGGVEVPSADEHTEPVEQRPARRLSSSS